MFFLFISAVFIDLILAESATAGTVDERFITSAKLADLIKSYSGDRTNENSIIVLHGFLIGNTPRLVVSYVCLAFNSIMSTVLAMAK